MADIKQMNMKNLVIIGAGNFSKILFEYALLSSEYNTQWDIKGFIDFELPDLKEDLIYPEVISTIDDYQVQKNDVFICSYVNPIERAKSIEAITGKGGQFISIIHATANVNRTAVIGKGVFIGAFTTVSIRTNIGNHVMIQDHCNIGHDSSIGDYSHLYVGNVICGKNQIGNQVALFTGTIIYPKLRIGNNAVVGAGSVVMRTVKESTTVLGNPAKIME